MLRVAARRAVLSVRSVRSFGSGGASASSAELEWDEDVRNATDVWDAQYHMKAQILMTEVLKIPKAEQAAFKNKYEISQGHWSLEWCHPSPMPFHTYEELPIIKEIGDRK